MKSLIEKVISYQTKITPKADYLAHYYWGNRWWSKIGVITVLAILLFSKLFFIVNCYFTFVLVFAIQEPTSTFCTELFKTHFLT